MEADFTVNLLVVDDNPANLLAMEELLRPLGQRIVTVSSGPEALRELLEDDFAVILLDVRMPDLDGIETAELIRSRDRCRNIPIIFLTGYARDDRQVFKGYSLGAVDYLTKPIVPEVLRSKVGVLVDLYCKTEQVRRQAEQLQQQQHREHEAELAREKQRWDMDRLRAEAAREKQNAAELTHLVAERIRAETQLRLRLEQQAQVAELGQQALAHPDLRRLMSEAVSRTATAMDLDYCVILELDEERKLQFRAGACVRGDAQRELQSWPDDLAALALQMDEPLIVKDLRLATHSNVDGHEVVSALGVTMSHEGSQPQGVILALTSCPRDFSLDDVNFLKSVAHLLVAARQRHEYEREVSAVKDQLALRLADMTRLHELSTTLAETLELQAVVDEVLRAILNLQSADAGLLVLEAASNGARPIVALSNLPAGAELKHDAFNDDDLLEAQVARALGEHVAGFACAQTLELQSRNGQRIGTIFSWFHATPDAAEAVMPVVDLYARQAAEVIDNARLYAEIRQANRRKDDFLAMLAHELRNPLAPIRNALTILRMGASPDMLEQAQDMADRQLQHLVRLVDDLLDVSRINQGKIHLRLQPIEIADVVDRALEITRNIIDAYQHQLEVQLPEAAVWVEGDATRLEQVLVNLLNNAAKYMSQGGRIWLSAEARGDSAVLRVRDAGMGIAPDLLPRIFDLFVQADKSLERSQGGLGIGLTLVRSLVTLHGGTIEVHSAGLGHGSEFVVCLPCTASRPPLPAAIPENSHACLQRRILVVDDNADAATSLAMLLRAVGHEVQTAHDGPEALEHVAGAKTDIVLLDIGLPGLDGLEVARRLRQNYSSQEMKLIALTGYGRDEDRQRSTTVGFDAHLTKPVEFGKLQSLINAGPRLNHVS